MKNIFFLFLLIASCSLTAQDTSNTKYMNAMKKSLATLDTAKTTNGYYAALNGFERIANAEKKEWLPKYYMAYCYLLISYNDATDMVDTYCDKADEQLEFADTLSKNNSEIVTLKALSAAARIRVNAMSRGAKYGALSASLNEEAKKLDPSNPRPYFLDGQGKFYTPTAFGGGKDKAKPLLEESLKKYLSFRPATAISPSWGKAQAEEMLKKCN